MLIVYNVNYCLMLKHYGAVYPKICFWPLVSRNARSNKNGRFDKTKQMFMDLTILVNFSQISQREISLADLMILTNFFCNFHYCLYFWIYLH